MGTLTTVLAVLAVVVVVALLINRKAVGTLLFNIRSAFGAGAKSVDNRNAVNNMGQAVDDAKAEIHGHVEKLNTSQGQIDSLTRDNDENNSEVARLTSQVQTRAREVNGDTNDAVLLDLAGQLTEAQERAADSAAELASQTALHNTVLGQVKDAVARADALEKQAERLGVKLELSATRAELASVGINFQKSSAHSSLSAAEGYADQIQKQIDTNNGAVKVAQDLAPKKGSAATADWQKEQAAKAALAKLGIGTSPSATTTEG